MSKILTVIEPFFIMEQGDTFELQPDGNTYTSVCNIEHSEVDDDNHTISSSYNSNFSISKDYAKKLIESGYLEESFSTEKEKNVFVNVFDEISTLLAKYTKELDSLNKDYADQPACLKVEKETVLKNMCKLLSHLNSLKK